FHKPEIIRLGSHPDNLLVDHGREILKRLTGAYMRNANNMMLAKNELPQSMAEKEELSGTIEKCKNLNALGRFTVAKKSHIGRRMKKEEI
ncbi:hypothetical protein Tco_1382933, partial [Tanacetum coccineum]